jgi:tetratricopeptide (TPR) repeat protein
MAPDQVSTDSIAVFFSYVGDVKTFVLQFSAHFVDNKGIMKTSDWLIDPIPAGAQLHQELINKINEADVFIAFVDKTYPNKIGAEELKSALDARADGNGRPLLVPIILGVDGLNWWSTVRDRTPESLSDIVYQKFYKPGTNRYRPLTVDDEQDIHDLRDWVINYLQTRQITGSDTLPIVSNHPTVPTISPLSISPPQISPPLFHSDGVASDQSGVGQRIAVALAALDSVEVHITTLRESLKNIGELLRLDLDSTNPAPSMGRREQIEAELRSEGVPSRLSRTVLAIIDRRDTAIKISDKESRSAGLLRLADELNAVIERERRPNGILAPQGDRKGASAFNYISRMEEALMRMQTEKPEALEAAIGIYRDLETLYSNKPAIPYRLGWAYYREQKYDEALSQYTKARYLIKEVVAHEAVEGSRHTGDYELTQMRQRLPRYIGLIYWKISDGNERARETEKQLDNLLTAYNVTSEGVGISGEADRSYHNDLSYYGLRYLEVFERNRGSVIDVAEPEITEDMVSKHLAYLEDRIDVEAHHSQEELDTLCYGYDLFKRGDQAVRAAKRLQYLLFEAPGHPAQLDSLQTAAAARVARIIARYPS